MPRRKLTTPTIIGQRECLHCRQSFDVQRAHPNQAFCKPACKIAFWRAVHAKAAVELKAGIQC